MSPAELLAGGVVGRLGGAALWPQKPTCFASGEPVAIDFFVACPELWPWVEKVEVVQGAPFRPHRPVRL
eukprot:8356878-Lingulodinium_polyedra.AAC.1